MIDIRPLVNNLRVKPGFSGIAEALRRIQEELDSLSKAQDVSAETASLTAETGAAPGDVTIVSALYDYAGASGDLRIIVYYSAPLTGAFEGVNAWIEDMDQSDAATFTLDGTTDLSGTAALYGDWSPEYIGSFPYDPTDPQPVVFTLPIPTQAHNLRIYLGSYNASVENDLVRAGDSGATPSIILAVAPPPGGPSGEEYAKNVTLGAVGVTTGQDGGVDTTHVSAAFTRPSDPKWSGVYAEVVYIDDKGNSVTARTISIQSPIIVSFRTPNAQQWASVRLRSFADPASTPDPADDSVNSYIPGVTPETQVLLGSTTGTIDFGKALEASIGSEFAKMAGLLRIAASGINATHIAAAAIGYAHIQAAAIQNAHLDRATANKIAIQNADIVSLAASKITAGTLAAGVIYSGTVNANQVNAGTLNAVNLVGGTLTLNLGGATTKISNQYDSWLGQIAGLTIANTLTPNLHTAVSQDSLIFVASGGVRSVYLTDNGGDGYLEIVRSPYGAGDKIILNAYLGDVSLPSNGGLVIGGNTVVSSRKAAVASPSGGSVIDVEARTAINAIINRLTSHGLISV